MNSSSPSLENLDKHALLALIKQQAKKLSLQDKELASQDRKLVSQDKKLTSQEQQLRYLEAQLRLALCRRYGKRSERQTDDPQSDLFNEAEELVACEDAAASDDKAKGTPVKGHTRHASSGRQTLPEHLPRETVEHDIPEEDKICACGCQKHRIGTDVSENLEYIPAKLYVEQHVRHQYACPQCEEGVQIADKPANLIPKSNAGANLLAFILVAKYQDALPLYRLSKIFARQGIAISRNTLARWVHSMQHGT